MKLFKILRNCAEYCVTKDRKNFATEKSEGSTSHSKQRRAERHNNIFFINLWDFVIFMLLPAIMIQFNMPWKFGFPLKKKKSNRGGGFELCLVQLSYFLKAFCLCCYNILNFVNCEFKGQLHHLLPKNGNICSENRKVVEYQLWDLCSFSAGLQKWIFAYTVIFFRCIARGEEEGEDSLLSNLYIFNLP